jgi:hypothetical protein
VVNLVTQLVGLFNAITESVFCHHQHKNLPIGSFVNLSVRPF